MDPLDWQAGKTPLQCTKYMLENEVNCDVNFKVGENGENIKAHKFILSMRTAVFDRMFNGFFCEAEKDPVIPDVTPAAFNMLLRYCYYESLDIKDDEALSIHYAATKYMLPLLAKAAKKKLIDSLSSSNVWSVYEYALNVGDTKLAEAAKKNLIDSLSSSNVWSVYEYALDVGDTKLAEATKEKLIDMLSSSNVWSVYKYAITVVNTKFLEGCHQYFQGSITAVKETLQAEEFLNIPHTVLLDLLRINYNAEKQKGQNEASEKVGNSYRLIVSPRKYKNDLGISISEIELFNACNRWAGAECLRQEIGPTGANKRTVLGECLFLIRFPTMVCKDLMNIVFLTEILTQTEKDNVSQYKHVETGSKCQGDFNSSERHFVVSALEPLEDAPDKSTVFIESEARVMLSKIWIRGAGSYRVTVRNESSEESRSMNYDTKHQGHCTKQVAGSYRIVYLLDIKEQVLQSGTKYSITADRKSWSSAAASNQVEIPKLVPFNEVKVTSIPGTKNSIHALTLFLV